MVDHTVGEVLRAERQRRRWSQAQAGALVGFSGSTLSRIERGTRQLHLDELKLFADRYGIAPTRLGLATVDPHYPSGRDPRGRDPREHPDESGDPVQRRQFLATATAAAAGLAIPPGVLRRLDDALVALPTAPGPVTSAAVTARLQTSQALFDRAQYATLLGGLPDLLAAAHELAETSTQPAAHAVVAACYSLATHALNKIGEHASSRLTADRAMTYARRADSALTEAMAARALGVVLRHEGRPQVAQRVTLDAIAAVEATGLTTLAQRAVLTQTLCTAAYSAATGGDQPRAVELIADADRAVAGLAGRPVTVGENVISPAQVQLYRVGVHWASGDSARALDAARGLRAEQFPTAERRGRLHTDLARAWWQHGRPEQTAAALLAAYREAPTELTGRPAIRRIGHEVLQHHPRTAGTRELQVALQR